MNAKQLKQLRKSKGMNQTDFGKLIGYSNESIKKWEGGNKISARALIMLKNLK